MNLTEQLMSTSLGSVMTSTDASALVEKGNSREIRAGECLFKAGDSGDALYLVLSGALEVILGQAGANATVVATVGAGQVVGELEVMTKSLRVATLAAKGEALVLELPGASLDAMLAENHPAATKVVTHIAKTLARRLAAVNQRIVEKAPKAPEPAAEDNSEPAELNDADLIPMDDEDLDVLDSIWSE